MELLVGEEDHAMIDRGSRHGGPRFAESLRSPGQGHPRGAGHERGRGEVPQGANSEALKR